VNWEERDKELVRKLKNGEELSEEEIIDIAYENVEGLSDYIKEKGEDRRWQRSVSTFFKTDDNRWFCLVWEEGLTENQDDEFWEQPYEVKREVKEVVTKVNVWTPVKKEGKQMFCNNCGEELNVGEDYVEFMGTPYCDDGCVHDMVEAELSWGIVEE